MQNRLTRWWHEHAPRRETFENSRILAPIAHRVLAPELWRFTRRSEPRGGIHRHGHLALRPGEETPRARHPALHCGGRGPIVGHPGEPPTEPPEGDAAHLDVDEAGQIGQIGAVGAHRVGRQATLGAKVRRVLVQQGGPPRGKLHTCQCRAPRTRGRSTTPVRHTGQPDTGGDEWRMRTWRATISRRAAPYCR